jgi:hypothetical protein
MDFKIEFEWTEGDPSHKGIKRRYPTPEEATEIYHAAEQALVEACRDRSIMLPDVAWMLTIDSCKYCGQKKRPGLIQ